MTKVGASTLFLLLASSIIDSALCETGEQAQDRVVDQLEYFMYQPVIALQVWSDFAHIGGFDNGMDASNRNEIARYLYSMTLSSSSWTPFYGLENGLFLAYLHSKYQAVPRLAFREPGESGYDSDDWDMVIYRNTCVDSYTGDEQQCVMESSGSYISCINDCELVPCPTTTRKENDCELLSKRDKEECESKTTWCKNYAIKKAAGRLLGYVPRSDHCIDSTGSFSQTVGEIQIETDSGGVNLGNCTYGSGELVSRELWGPYKSCGDDGALCGTTYVGAYKSSDYDPRFRGWYIAAKETQQPRWSDPYVFFSLQEIGITYAHPINSTDEEGRTVFTGVLAADLLLGDISNFLVAEFNATDLSVAVYEKAEPHSMVGISTGSEIVQKVLSDDPTQPCADEQSENGECTLIQITINDLDGSTDEIVLRNAHFALENTGFDPAQIVTVKEKEGEVYATAYLATFEDFAHPEANLEWRIIVTQPLERDPEDAITKGEPLFVIVCVTAGLGFAICSALVILFFLNRNERAVLLADFKFTSAFITACALLNLSTITLLGENTDEKCMLRMWLPYMLSSMALSPLFVKAFRTWRLLGAAPSEARKARMNNFQAWIRTLPIPLLQAMSLILFTFFDPPQATEEIYVGGKVPTQSLTCEHETVAFVIVQTIFWVILLAMGCILAYLTRNIDPRFADAKALLFAMYNIAFTVLMFIAIVMVVNIPASGLHMMTTIGVFWVTVFSSAVFVVPTLMTAKADKKKEKERLSRLRVSQARTMTKRFSSEADVSYNSIHESEETLKVLICSANIGNAEPTLESMRAWIPEGGSCAEVTTLDGVPIESERFDVIAIGMQESTWSAKKEKRQDGREKYNSDEEIAQKEETGDDLDDGKSELFLAAVEGEDTVALRKMEKKLLGSQYNLVKEVVRGQMRLHVWALENVMPFLDNIKVSGANTGIGNVLANKGGIIVSFEYQKTRFSFLSAHLAAHEGDSYYQARCENVHDILESSKTFKLSHTFDLSLSSHHMFVFGDLNFRTKFEQEAKHEDNVKRALELIEAKDFATLYSFDELHKGVKKGDLLVGFETLPCQFHPTFKVQREPGFVYKEQRTPSYTDRILYKSAQSLVKLVKPLSYEPCVDFVTSDHKPIRGAFSIATNEMIDPHTLEYKFRMEFSEMSCSDLPAGDVTGFSDPFLMFIWDGIELEEEKRRGFRLPQMFLKHSWPSTSYVPKTLNPKWKRSKIVLVTTSKEINSEAVLYVGAFDYDFGSKDDVLGTLPLNIQELVSMKRGQTSKEVIFDHPLQANGKHAGQIKFKLNITAFIG